MIKRLENQQKTLCTHFNGFSKFCPATWKKLEKHRGIFIVVIVSIKALKNRITPVLSENMTTFQRGGIKGKGVVDNLFIMRALISQSLYVN